jgi:tetratricopeptide (TPR) repeat protein
MKGGVSAHERALALKPGYPFVLQELALDAFLHGDFKRAADLERRALEVEPGRMRCRVGLDAALQRGGDHVGARAALRDWIDYNPLQPEAWSRLAVLHSKRGSEVFDPYAALAAAQVAIELNGDELNRVWITARRARSSALARVGALDRAIAQMDEVITCLEQKKVELPDYQRVLDQARAARALLERRKKKPKEGKDG